MTNECIGLNCWTWDLDLDRTRHTLNSFGLGVDLGLCLGLIALHRNIALLVLAFVAG